LAYFENTWMLIIVIYRIKKPKTFRYPSLKGTDPKFRRNHRHALHGTMKALVRSRSPKRLPSPKRMRSWEKRCNEWLKNID
jgi:hypothetical protein